MSPRFVLGRENVPCVAEVVNRSLKADCTDFTSCRTEVFKSQLQRFYKLMSYERAFKMLKNYMCITEIGQAVLEL